ncbi:MAG: hemolysin III family protein [Burkholderiales bacterium]
MYHGERFNGYSHLLGSVLAVVGAVTLIVYGSLYGDVWKVVSFTVYGAALILLFGFSTLYHSTKGRTKNIFRKLDHSAIYLLIAGTYTPFTLVTLRGAWGWSLFGVVWGLALIGLIQELTIARGQRWGSLVLYIVMGWLAVAGVVPMIEALTWKGFLCVAFGGVVYTLGTVFYFFDDKFKHWHGIWHLCVLGGAAIHYFAIFAFVA